MIKPLDFVRPKDVRGKRNTVVIIDPNGTAPFVPYLGEPYPNQYVGLVTEVDKSGKCSIEWLGEGNKHLHNAWWKLTCWQGKWLIHLDKIEKKPMSFMKGGEK